MMSYKSFTMFQALCLVLCFVGAFFVDWNLHFILLACLSYFLHFTIGVSIMMHRFWSHKSFQFKYKWVEYVFTAIALKASRGSPLAWVHIHREHHAHADTEKDPHAPSNFKLFSFKSAKITEFKAFLVRDMLTKEHKFLHEKYWYLVGIFPLLLLFGGLNLVYFGYLLPIVFLQIVQDLWNYFSHVHGYRNFKLDNESRNVMWLWPLIGGEAWHNNHHASPKAVSTKQNWWELDPASWIIKLVRK